MTLRQDISRRYFSADSPLREEVTEAFESAQQALDLVPLISFRWLRGVVATGAAGSELASVEWGAADNIPTVAADATSGPAVALIVRAVDTATPDADVGSVRSRLNHRYDSSGGVNSVTLFEPEGLTADSTYDFVILFVGGV